MVLISYDIANDKKRAKFNRYIKKFGSRMQYSVYQIDNSDRILRNIVDDINQKFLKTFDESDSVYIFRMSNTCEVIRFGYAKHDVDESILVY